MRIASIKINNYKSFYEPEEVKLTSGINIVIGKNNSGKTAFLQAASLRFGRIPHKSPKTIPHSDSPILNDVSSAEVVFEVQETELLELFRTYSRRFLVPLVVGQDSNEFAEKFISIISRGARIHTKYIANQSPMTNTYLEEIGNVKSQQGIRLEFSSNYDLTSTGIETNKSENEFFGWDFGSTLLSRIYFLNAERLNISISPVSADPLLQPNAANLPAVINDLTSRNHEKFKELTDHFYSIFPEIKWLNSVLIRGSTNVQLQISNSYATSGREDLCFAIADCGTGVGQVLAILYLIVTSKYSCVIVIDEPQSFLHPGAVHKLFEILKHYPQHQYIVSTHSPNIRRIGLTLQLSLSFEEISLCAFEPLCLCVKSLLLAV